MKAHGPRGGKAVKLRRRTEGERRSYLAGFDAGVEVGLKGKAEAERTRAMLVAGMEAAKRLKW